MGAIPVCAGRTLIGAYQGVKWMLGSTPGDTGFSLERPPQLEPQTRIEDTIIQDWRWLALRCERRLIHQSKRKGPTRHIAEVLGAKFDIDQFACFVPRTVLEAIADCRIRYSDDFDIIIEHFNGAVVFCDASGFTALTEALDKEPDGAEKLGECINAFFGPLIQVVSYWGGDIIKFSGDALTIVWPVDDEPTDKDITDISDLKQGRSSRFRMNTTNSMSSGDDIDEEDDSRRVTNYCINKQQACRLACQCCLDLHFNLNFFPTPVEGKFFTLHIGVGFGRITILQVGGTLDRWEYVVAGPPLQEISIAEPLAGSGETVISPTVVEALGGDKGAELSYILSEGNEGYAKLLELKGPEVIPPPPLENIILDNTDVDLLKRFIPPAVFKRLTAGHNVFINELRRVSVVFVGVHGLDVSTDRGSHAAHKLMQLTQKAAYTMEGSVNKFLVDDKGVLILIMFGLPPVYHLDDALRAVMAALRIVDGLRMLGLTAGIGVATGRVWCGTVGCWLRKEYTAMGDTVNLAARLMGKAQCNEINCDIETKSLCDTVMEFRALPPVSMKGKQHLVPVYQPTGRMNRQAVLQTTTGEPINTWEGWKYKQRIYKILFPGYEYRHPIVDIDRPPLDFPIHCGPLFPWEYIEPWMSSLRPTVDLGGVAVIIGKETEGTTELVHYISQLTKRLGRSIFLCSNMPDSTHVNIGNVPLLAWRKLCTEIVETWRWSPARERKGYSKVDRDNSMYGLSKELIHPIFHWRLHEMKSIIHGLVLPYEVPENQAMDRDSIREEGVPKKHKKRMDRMLKKASNFVSALRREDRAGQVFFEDHNDDKYADPLVAPPTMNNPYISSNYSLPDEEEQSLAPVICSLVNGFSMYQCTIVCLHVRAGTSLFASMDSESWKVARLVGRIAMMRRRRKIELDMKELKKWRRKHSRDCVWCHGTAQPFEKLKGEICHPKWTSWCKPLPSKYFPPFIFLLVCSETTSHVPEQKELIEWAKESNCLIEMRRMSPVETGSYLAHCLSVSRKSIPDELIEYVYRISAGIPKYIFLTARQLITEQAIIIEDIHSIQPDRALTDVAIETKQLNQQPLSDTEYPDSLHSTQQSTLTDPLTIHSHVDSKTEETTTDPEKHVEERKVREFSLVAQGLTGHSGIPEDANTSDADSEARSNSSEERRRGGSGKYITVYKFSHEMKLKREAYMALKQNAYDKTKASLLQPNDLPNELKLKTPPVSKDRALSPINDLNSQLHETNIPDESNTSQQNHLLELQQISDSQHNIFLVDELRVSQVCRINPETELDLIGDIYVKKKNNKKRRKKERGLKRHLKSSASVHNLQTNTSSTDDSTTTDDTNDIMSSNHGQQEKDDDNKKEEQFNTFLTAFNDTVKEDTQYSTAKYQEPITDEESKNLTNQGNEKFKDFPVFKDPYHSSIRKPFLPPGPELFTSRVGQLAFAPVSKPNYETSYACQTAQHIVDDDNIAHSKDHIDEHVNSLNDTKISLQVRVIKDLKKVPFVSDLRAAAMSLMERLEPDEQLAAKVASVFPVAFTGFEVQAVYPRQMSSESFQEMIENLITKEMLENCEAPTEEQLQELDLLPLQHPNPTATAAAAAAAAAGATDMNSINKPTQTKSQGKSHPFPRKLSYESNTDSLISEAELISNRWGFDEDGNPVFYRFTSIAFQHVVADLIMSQEREFLARISRKVICFRRTYGLSFLIQQINAKPTDKPLIGRVAVQQEKSRSGFISSWDPSANNVPDEKPSRVVGTEWTSKFSHNTKLFDSKVEG